MDKKEKYTVIGAVAGSVALLAWAFMQRQRTVKTTVRTPRYTAPKRTTVPVVKTTVRTPQVKTTVRTPVGGGGFVVPTTVAIDNNTWALLKLKYGNNSVELRPGQTVVINPDNKPIDVYIVVGGITGPAPGKSVYDYYCFTMNPPYQNVYVITGSDIQQCWANAIFGHPVQV